MRRILYLGFTIFTILLVPLSAHGEVYTLDKCIDTGLQNNSKVIAARNNFDASRWGVYSAYGNILPSISISANRQTSWSGIGVTYIEGIPFATGGKVTHYGGSLSLSANYGGLGISNYANITQSRAQKNSTYYGFIGAQNDLVLNIKQAYYNDFE